MERTNTSVNPRDTHVPKFSGEMSLSGSGWPAIRLCHSALHYIPDRHLPIMQPPQTSPPAKGANPLLHAFLEPVICNHSCNPRRSQESGSRLDANGDTPAEEQKGSWITGRRGRGSGRIHLQVPEVPSSPCPKQIAESSVDTIQSAHDHNADQAKKAQPIRGWGGVSNTAITLKTHAAKGFRIVIT